MLDSRIDVKKEALINEYKGNLFEYLVGQFLARYYGLEEQFLNELLPEFKKRLERYEHELRLLDSNLIKFLIKAADITSKDLLKELRLTPRQIFVTGKTTHEGECDLFIIDEFNQSVSISLKLAKSKSFVNTKSGGAKSFIETYFTSNNSQQIQKNFNQLVDSAWANMGQKLYDEEGLGHFDQFKTWREHNLSELPGELTGKNKENILMYYDEITNQLEKEIQRIAKVEPESFEKSLAPILGFSSTIGLQVITEHEKEQVTQVRIISEIEVKKDLSNYHFSRSSEAKSSFLINFPKFILQIRLKPMNKFTAGSMKVNCSVKYF